ncbi:vacuolar protein sorting-associated protein VTA1 homolog [Toxorhynchites rutilus septentrionalis]|uniref:vacuolar protein sorting-associated protein VTA1 homolog n=1 Tax=Toxorhynchites rutilus septentrionalis TaxID=329112 RepID=UPI002478E225|nr:vacuolar protein sorting-associated protein VTA1 homolog [Toxorhynchites rutilus septentrionalis]
MMASNFPEVPASLKLIAHYLKTAQEHDSRDAIVSYWCRLYALQLGLKINSQGSEERKLLITIMDWLEQTKKANAENESITNEVAAQAYLENYALKLFLYADKQDRASNFGKNVVKAFYTAGMVYDVLQTFGELTEEVIQNRKYAKWKASYIHNCLKNGETPIPGPMSSEEDNELEDLTSGPSEAPQDPTPGPSNAPQVPYPSMGFQGFPQTGEQPDLLSSPPTGPTNFVTNDPFRNIKPPTPPSEPEKPPGGFQPYTGPPVDVGEVTQITAGSGVQLTPDQLTKAQKYCKFAGSALIYEDVKTAIDNLQKALRLLQTGQDG